jgi:SAM-dependent methyltransferase
MILQACPYYTMFLLDFPMAWLRKARPGEWVLDPFCGRGTTLYAARLAGLPAVGVDISPVAAALAEGMLSWASPEEVAALARRLLQEGWADPPEGEFWELAYHRRTLEGICRLREGLLQGADGHAARLLRLILLGRLHGPLRKGAPAYLSNQMPRTYAPKPDYAVRFWKARGLRPPEVDPLELLACKAREILRDLPPPVSGRVLCGDARTADFRALGGPFDWVITSPPYYGMRTYVPDQWLRYWLVGGPPRVAYRYEGQLGRGPADAYVTALRAVWGNVARACRPKARLVVRFGALPSRKSPDPVELLCASLRGTPWRIRWLRRAGSPEHGRRQVRTFHPRPVPAVEEIDVLAVLAE